MFLYFCGLFVAATFFFVVMFNIRFFQDAVNGVSSFLNGIVTNESPDVQRLDRYKKLYEDVTQIIAEMQEKGEEEREDWIGRTNISQDLNQMIDILVEEEKDLKKSSRDSYDNSEQRGLCLDYLLKQHLVDTFCGIAIADNPKGCMELFTTHITRLLKEVKYPLSTTEAIQITISALMQKLVQMYQSTFVSSSMERVIILFIEVVCEKICEDPVLINAFFIKSNAGGGAAAASTGTGSAGSAATTTTTTATTSSSSPDRNSGASFSLVGPLIPHLYPSLFFLRLSFRNESSSIGRTSRQLILLLAAFPDTQISLYLTHNTQMVGLLTQNLLDAILQFDSMNSVASQMESPEDVLKHRLQFISELLSLCRSSVDCKDDPNQALVLYSAILDSILSSVLHGYIEVELLNIRFFSLFGFSHPQKRANHLQHSHCSPSSLSPSPVPFLSPHRALRSLSLRRNVPPIHFIPHSASARELQRHRRLHRHHAAFRHIAPLAAPRRLQNPFPRTLFFSFSFTLFFAFCLASLALRAAISHAVAADRSLSRQGRVALRPAGSQRRRARVRGPPALSPRSSQRGRRGRRRRVRRRAAGARADDSEAVDGGKLGSDAIGGDAGDRGAAASLRSAVLGGGRDLVQRGIG